MGSGAGQAQVHVLRRGARILDLPKVPHCTGRHFPGLPDLWHAPGPSGGPRSGESHGGTDGSSTDLSKVQHGEPACSKLLCQVREQILRSSLVVKLPTAAPQCFNHGPRGSPCLEQVHEVLGNLDPPPPLQARIDGDGLARIVINEECWDVLGEPQPAIRPRTERPPNAVLV